MPKFLSHSVISTSVEPFELELLNLAEAVTGHAGVDRDQCPGVPFHTSAETVNNCSGCTKSTGIMEIVYVGRRTIQ